MFHVKYDNFSGICPSLLTVPAHYVLFLNCCRHPFGSATITKFPVFKPNQYFWDNFWEPVKDKESRADTYCRIMRTIYLEETGLKDSSEHAQISRKIYGDILLGKEKIEEDTDENHHIKK